MGKLPYVCCAAALAWACSGSEPDPGAPQGDADPFDGGATSSSSMALPNGSREFEGILNLVDAEAAEQLASFLRPQEPVHLVLRQGLTEPVNRFLEHYREEYDFIYFFTDRFVDGSEAVGVFEAINSKGSAGSGRDIEIALGGYRSNGRLKGVAGFNYTPGVFPPLAHETLHYWANYLDPDFGFGEARSRHYGPHWGLSSVNGQLGGYDATTLACETPAGSVPPDCTPLASGRTRYVVGAFAPNSNSFRDVAYAPLELYLIGLAGPAEVPDAFQLMQQAELLPETFDEVANTVVVEADGIVSLPFAEIIARHGEVVPLGEAERDFSAAFVVVSAQPVSDETMAEVASWAATFGGRESGGPSSFEQLTDGRATMSTLLGQRRTVDEPAPEIRERFVCDVVAQDCGSQELGCYVSPPPVCARSGGVALGQPCNALYACAPGLDCVSGSSDPAAFVCQPYCDLADGSSPQACQDSCPNSSLELRSSAGEVWGGLCVPP